MPTALDLVRLLPHEFRAIPLRAIVAHQHIASTTLMRPEDDAELVGAIATHGVQLPIVVDTVDGISFRVIDGERRRSAALRAGFTHVPAAVYLPVPQSEALRLHYVSQYTSEPLWDEREYPRMLRAVLNAQLVAKNGAHYASEYKWRMLGLASDCTRPGELVALLRSEGLTHTHLAAWRKQFDESGSFDDRRLTKHAPSNMRAPQCRSILASPYDGALIRCIERRGRVDAQEMRSGHSRPRSRGSLHRRAVLDRS